MLRQRIDRLERLARPGPVDVLFCWQGPTPRALETVKAWRRANPDRGAGFFWVDGDAVTLPEGGHALDLEVRG